MTLVNKEQNYSLHSFETLCTFAATGRKPVFQAVYICHTCCMKPEDDSGQDLMPLCICQGCAESCHECFDHDVEYIGVGPSYCDCSSIERNKSDGNDGECACILEEASKVAATKLGIKCTNGTSDGIYNGFHFASPGEKVVELDLKRVDADQQGVVNGHKFPYKYQVFTIPQLVSNCSDVDSEINENPRQLLIQQALELVKYTTETHWIPFHSEKNEIVANQDDMCALERLASSIFLRHIQEYDLKKKFASGTGAEWWVQVKKNNTIDNTKKETAIDLHYDKDEELAATFGLGVFPTLSTVTYLTDNEVSSCVENTVSSAAAPTLVFSHTYDMSDNGPIGNFGSDEDKTMVTPQVIISHARAGKHLIFDGRLLHGAPANLLLREKNPDMGSALTDKDLRISFLVNIWLERPFRVSVLNSEIRSKIHSSVGRTDSNDAYLGRLDFCHRDVTSISNIDTPDSLSESCKNEEERVYLPFVSMGAVWIEDDDDDNDDDNNKGNTTDGNDEVGLVVSMLPPPLYEGDTVLVSYGPLCEPCLERIDSGDERLHEDDDTTVVRKKLTLR